MASSLPAATSSSSPADLARGPDGRWRIIDTHTETPAGIGYAIANRMVHTNVAGDIFGACHAHAAGALLPAAAGRACTPCQSRRSDDRPADAGTPPQRLLQPRLSRPLSGPAAGRGRRSARHRRSRLAQDAARPDADRSDRALRGRRRGRPAGARRFGLRRSRRPAAGHPQAARPRGQRAGDRARREPRLERLPAEARQRSAGRGPAGAGRAQVVAGRCSKPPPRAGQPRAHGHPSGARGHRPAGPRHPGHRPRAPGSRRARPAAAGDRDQGRRAGRRGEGRLRHDAVADRPGPGAEALCGAPVRGRDRQRLHGAARGPRHDGRPRSDRGAQRARRGIARRVGDQRRHAAALHQPVAAHHRGRAGAPLAPRSAEPCCRQPVLARPLHRARRLDHAHAAHLPQPPAGGQRAAPGAARQPHRAGDPARQGRRQDPRRVGDDGRGA